jgi:hypothetical protein
MPHLVAPLRHAGEGSWSVPCTQLGVWCVMVSIGHKTRVDFHNRLVHLGLNLGKGFKVSDIVRQVYQVTAGTLAAHDLLGVVSSNPCTTTTAVSCPTIFPAAVLSLWCQHVE